MLVTRIFYLHVVHEQRMVSSGRYNPNFDSILRIPIQKLIIDKDLQKKDSIVNHCSLKNPQGMRMQKWVCAEQNRQKS